ncbi:type II secretion system protein [Campylobacter pinnipediorum]|uniref:type II secretion system protein n=1 Tax=Campylobacter pinnipediorum TaxID=1965231 RepID=UPI0009958F1E|nr:type II secretion system protein [Campylobacter pinnipediorum]AQW82372.1 putative type II secretion system protein [Campylobacter pinnipediorum subsp. pinnipediorum]
MKKAFTMIELVFVIVILGILSAIAVPKFLATRDDAEIVNAAKNLSTFVSDIGMHYTSRVSLSDNLEDMTNVRAIRKNEYNGNYYLMTNGKECIKIRLIPEDKINSTPSYLEITQNEATKRDPLCQKIIQYKSIQNIMSTQFKYIQKTNKIVGQDRSSATPVLITEYTPEVITGIPLGMSSIKW